MAGIELHAVLQLEQPAQAVEEALRALGRLDCEIRPRGVADQERVAGQDEPGLRRARAVGHREAAVLGAVTRRVDHAERHLADLDLRSVLERLERVVRLGGGVNGDGDAVLEREPAVP